MVQTCQMFRISVQQIAPASSRDLAKMSATLSFKGNSDHQSYSVTPTVAVAQMDYVAYIAAVLCVFDKYESFTQQNI